MAIWLKSPTATVNPRYAHNSRLLVKGQVVSWCRISLMGSTGRSTDPITLCRAGGAALNPSKLPARRPEPRFVRPKRMLKALPVQKNVRGRLELPTSGLWSCALTNDTLTQALQASRHHTSQGIRLSACRWH